MFERYFDEAFDELLFTAKGYSVIDNGEVFSRIVRKDSPDWSGWKLIDQETTKTAETINDIAALNELARSYLFNKVWTPVGCETISRIDTTIAKELFITAVDIGKEEALIALQHAINAKVEYHRAFKALVEDGIFGDASLTALQICCQDQVRYEHLRKDQIAYRRKDIETKTIEVAKEPSVKVEISDPFEYAYVKTGGHEGGYANNPKDPGAETWAGIARSKHPSAKIWAIIDKQPVKTTKTLSAIKELEPLVKDFYYNEFWLKFKCDKIASIHPPIAIELYDSCVNTGGNGAKMLQRALNRLNVNQTLWPDILDDGGVGNITLTMVAKCCSTADGKDLLLACQNGEQYAYYCGLKDHEYWRGWFNRT